MNQDQSSTSTPGRPFGMTRRTALASASVALLSAAPQLLAQGRGVGTITVLYRREQGTDVDRRDTGALAAISQVEQGLSERHFQVVKPGPDVLALMDGSEEVIINFDPGAGACVMLSVTKVVRPMPAERTAVEVRARAQVFYGPSQLLSGGDAEGVGRSIAMVPGPDAERRASEVAGREAAKQVALRVAEHLRSLSPQRLAELARPVPSVVAGGVALPPRPPGPSVTPAPVAQPPAAGAGGTTAPANVALPAVRRRYALIVGVSDFSPIGRATQGKFRPSSLPGVARDVKRLAGAMLKLGFASEDIKVLFNAEATSANVRDHLMTLVGTLQPDDLVFVAFSSHGAPAQYSVSGYGLPILSDYQGPGDKQALDFWQVQGLIGHLPCRQVVLVVDTCHSGGVAQRMPRLTVDKLGNTQVSSGTVTPEPARLASMAGDSGKHFAILAASQPEELSLEEGGVGGLFTSKLLGSLEANRGSAPVSALFRDKVHPEVVERSHEMCKRLKCPTPGQTPVFAFAGRGDLIRL
jgi:hypothetical protein